MRVVVSPNASTGRPQALPELERLPLPALAVAVDDTVVAANAAARALLSDDWAGSTLAELLPRSPCDAGGARWRTEVVDRAGVPHMIDVHAGPPAGGVRIVLFLLVSEAVKLDASSDRLAAAFDTAPIGMALFNPSGHYVRVNPALCGLLGRTAEELLGRRDQELTHPDDREADLVVARDVLAGIADTFTTEKRFLRPDGEVVWAIANMTFLRDEAGLALHWLGQFQDITPTKVLEERLQRLADEDTLTGLPNRRRFERELADALQLSGRHGSPGALLLLDLDDFKAINDEHGHAAGDAALVATSRALQRRLRRTDVLARIGGDEFALLLPRVVEQGARAVAVSVRQAVAEAVLPVGIDATLQVSVGIATFGTAPLPTVAELLADADARMYDAKRGAVR